MSNDHGYFDADFDRSLIPEDEPEEREDEDEQADREYDRYKDQEVNHD